MTSPFSNATTMKKTVHSYPLNSVTDLHRLLELPKPEHPLVSVINMDEIKGTTNTAFQSILYNLYSICIKKNYTGKLKYGQHYYDFDSGTMTFFAPGQIVAAEVTDDNSVCGWWLIFHPDFIRNYPLAKLIKNYGYFSYAVNEALHLSEKEDTMITTLIKNIGQEYRSTIDNYSQDVIISQIELLLTYCNRFYNRQFITRKNASNDLLIKFEAVLSSYFETDQTQQHGLPTVQHLSAQLHVSANYLSDMLKTITGQTTQQHIHEKLIAKAKEILTTTSLSISEIAYELGFEYSQSFNKLFKNKTSVTPLAFRQSFN